MLVWHSLQSYLEPFAFKRCRIQDLVAHRERMLAVRAGAGDRSVRQLSGNRNQADSRDGANWLQGGLFF